MRKPIIAGNWKLNKNRAEAEELAKGIVAAAAQIPDVEILLCPVYTALDVVRHAVANSRVMLGAQDVFWETAGAFTGEVSASLLKDAGCSHVIIGHSERRQYFHETNETVNRKVKAVLAAGLTPIVCVGETLPERENGRANAVVEDHVRGGLAELTPDQIGKIIIAYEPVWAIGTGKTATPEQAQEMHSKIRGWLKELAGESIAEQVRIQYGGSVKPDNVDAIMGQKDVDGALVGGASLKAETFVPLLKFKR